MTTGRIAHLRHYDHSVNSDICVDPNHRLLFTMQGGISSYKYELDGTLTLVDTEVPPATLTNQSCTIDTIRHFVFHGGQGGGTDARVSCYSYDDAGNMTYISADLRWFANGCLDLHIDTVNRIIVASTSDVDISTFRYDDAGLLTDVGDEDRGYDVMRVGIDAVNYVAFVGRDTVADVFASYSYNPANGVLAYKDSIGLGARTNVETDPASARLGFVGTTTLGVYPFTYGADGSGLVLGTPLNMGGQCESIGLDRANNLLFLADSVRSVDSFRYNSTTGALTWIDNDANTPGAIRIIVDSVNYMIFATGGGVPAGLDSYSYEVDAITITSTPTVDVSTKAQQYGMAYTWYFGDGEQSTEREPHHIYKMPGEYLVRRVRVCPNGITDISYLMVYVYEWDLTGDGMHVVYSDTCIRNAVTQQQGVGMVEWGGANWLWPEAYVGTCNGYDKNNETISIVLDTFSGLHFKIGVPEQWLDREMNLEYFFAGYEIPSWFRLPEHLSSGGEFQDVRLVEAYVYMRPFYEKDREKEGFRTGDGFREKFQVGGVMYKGGDIVFDDDLQRVPLKADWTFKKKIQDRRIQLEINTTTSAYRCVGVQQKVVELEKKPGPALNTKSETVWGREFRQPDFWISRDSTNPLINRATAQTVVGSWDYLSEGPDKYSNSAMVFSGSHGFQATLNSLTTSTLLVWLRNLTGTVRLWDFGAQSIILHYEGDEWIVTIDNGVNSIEVPLGWNGREWALLTIKTTADMVRTLLNKTSLGYQPFSFWAYGGTTNFMSNSQGEVFDIRRLPRTISEEAIHSYYDAVIDDRGGSFLPIMR